jgi:hypothetical protein
LRIKKYLYINHKSTENKNEVNAMSRKIDKDIDVRTPAAQEPITDFEMVMAKIENDAHKSYKGIENIALENPEVKP